MTLKPFHQGPVKISITKGIEPIYSAVSHDTDIRWVVAMRALLANKAGRPCHGQLTAETLQRWQALAEV